MVKFNLNARIEKVIAGRWIAGYYTKDALERTRLFNAWGISTMINYLGEETRNKAEVGKSVRTYIKILNEIKKQNLDAAISLKPTQIGLRISYKLMRRNYATIVKKAAANRTFVWLDMETPDCVDSTIRAYTSIKRHRNTGICIQAYLKRSINDANALARKGAIIRLVKGAYKADKEICHVSRRSIDVSYMRIMKILFSNRRKFMVATHDPRIINEARMLNREHRGRAEFGLLNGIRNKYALHLVMSGEKVAVYVPFGRDWIGYGLRRMTEQRHLSLIIRSLFEKQRI